jgi:tetratricopeptide (TPR) repeat protein
MRLGTSYATLGQLQRASEYLTKAFELREHASEHEKLRITENYYRTVIRDLPKAAATGEEILVRYPRDLRVYTSLGNTYHELGDFEKEIRVVQHATRI